jgi:hypothetical protein
MSMHTTPVKKHYWATEKPAWPTFTCICGVHSGTTRVAASTIHGLECHFDSLRVCEVCDSLYAVGIHDTNVFIYADTASTYNFHSVMMLARGKDPLDTPPTLTVDYSPAPLQPFETLSDSQAEALHDPPREKEIPDNLPPAYYCSRGSLSTITSREVDAGMTLAMDLAREPRIFNVNFTPKDFL